MTSTEAFLSERTKVRALYSKKHNEVPLNVWRGGTVVAISDEPYQQREPSDKGDGELKFWPDGNKKMQIDITLQTAERNSADPDDTGLRKVFVPDNGRSPGSLIVEIGNACREVSKYSVPAIGGELYILYAGETPSKNTALADRKLWKAAYRPPANQFFATEVPGALAPQASSNGQPAQQFVPAAHPTIGAIGYQPATQPVATAPQQPVAAAMQQPWEQPATPQQIPQWPSAPPQSQPPTAAPPAQQPAAQGQQWPPGGQQAYQPPPAQQPAAQGQQWPPGGQQAYQPPPVDPRNPFG